MRRSGSLLLTVLILWAAPARSHAALIGIDKLKLLAAGRSVLPGVHVYDTGPNGPFRPIIGNWEVIGPAAPILLKGASPSFFDATVTFDQPLKSAGIDVQSTGACILGGNFTLEAYFHGRRVAWETDRLAPPGDVTHIELAAADIDKVEWSGSGEIFNPYFIRALRYAYAHSPTPGPSHPPAPPLTVSAEGPPPDPLPQVGSVVPEPSFAGGAIAVCALVLMRRPQSSSSTQ